MAEHYPSDGNGLIAGNAISWPASGEGSGWVKFVCDAEDRTGQKQGFEFECEIHPEELRKGLTSPDRQRDLLCTVVNFCKPRILDTKPWMCMACDLQACEMINTPRLHASTSELMPVITDMLPLFICSRPACQAEARRFSERVIKTHRAMLVLQVASTCGRGRRMPAVFVRQFIDVF